MNDLPRDGVRILELGGYVAAPYATALLGALGAEAVKVERPDGGDAFRRGDEDRIALVCRAGVLHPPSGEAR